MNSLKLARTRVNNETDNIATEIFKIKHIELQLLQLLVSNTQLEKEVKHLNIIVSRLVKFSFMISTIVLILVLDLLY